MSRRFRLRKRESSEVWAAPEWRPLVVVAIVAVLALLAIAVLGVAATLSNLTLGGAFRTAPPVTDVTDDPYTTLPLYADPGSQIVTAAAADARLTDLAAVPQARWFTDWTDVDTVAGAVSAYVGAAAARHEIPVAVLYRIPDRDCGGHASGGAADAAEYRAWIDEVARGIAGRPAIVVVEPDAVGQLGKCTGPQRARLLRYATEKVAATGAWVYIDAGHSDWWPPAEMASRLEDVGVAAARGFTTNVANHQSTADERAYADELVDALAARGIEDRHYLVDTGRNGGEVAPGDRCNAPGARLGRRPELVFDGKLDGYLWVKPPAESDGRCHGGPVSGFYDHLALMLLGRSNSIEK